MLSRCGRVHPRLLTAHRHAHGRLSRSSASVRLAVRPSGLLLRLLAELRLLLAGEDGEGGEAAGVTWEAMGAEGELTEGAGRSLAWSHRAHASRVVVSVVL